MKLDLNKFSKPRKVSVDSSKTVKRKTLPSPSVQTPIQSKINVQSNQHTRRKTTNETNMSPSNVRDDP